MAGVVSTAVAVSGVTAVLAGGGGAAARWEAVSEQVSSVPTAPTLQTIDLVTATGRSLATPGSPRSETAVGQRATRRFSLLGVTWTDPTVVLDGAVEVRTRRAADQTWTGWQRLDADGVSPAEPGSREAAAARGSTDPLWVGDSDGVEARLAGRRSRPLPAGLRVDLISPGDPGSSAAAPPMKKAAYRLPSLRDEVTVPPRPLPAVVSRARWGANERIVKGNPEYTSDVQVLFVHHTAGTNSYRCTQSAAIIRSIQAYHVRSKHWDDIGYNFLVDKCGTLFEGRGGGVSRPVLGAHTLGFNAHSSAVAVLGNFTGRGVSARVKRVIAHLAAYKIGAYGNAPAGRAAMVSSGSDRYAKGSTARLNRISGHRDTGRTACPGTTLYGQLGSIRSIAAAGPTGLALAKMNGATNVGRNWYTRGTIRPYWKVDLPVTLLHRFDVFVDGVLAASVPRAERQQLLTLPEGEHTVRIRAVALNGRTAVTDVSVVVDQTLPEFTSEPDVSLRTGSLNGIVPVRMRWDVTDANGLSSLAVTSPVPANLPTGTTVWAGTVKPGDETTFGVRATDRAGNSRSAEARQTAFVATETLAEPTGIWSPVADSVLLGGQALRSTTADSSLTWAFTGRSAALAVTRTAVSGRVRIVVDDEPAGIVDLRSPETLNRRAVWTRAWAESDRHTVRVEVEGTTGRPGVVLDGLAYLR